MELANATLLIVDDEVFNLEILVEHLEDEGYRTVSAENGQQAWELLEAEPTRFHAVLLDRMMPHMDGMEVLARIKAHPQLKTLPVIMQTAKAAKEDVLEGLKSGAYYYLTKPFEKDTLLTIVDAAVADFRRYQDLQTEVERTAHTLSLMEHGRFAFRTLEEAGNLATLLANAGSKGHRLVIGLSELFFNAIEHGNLGIDYQEKSRLTETDQWQAEVERRLALPEFADKQVRVEFAHGDGELRFLISDQGEGFEWHDYLEVSPDRAFDSHGRGIAMARALSFDSLEYRGRGNEVMAVVKAD